MAGKLSLRRVGVKRAISDLKRLATYICPHVMLTAVLASAPHWPRFSSLQHPFVILS
jgi:hypothetical protein